MTFYICESCNSVFTTSIRKPLALPCGHTYCLKCIRLQYTATKYMKCPKCSVKHFIHYNDFPVNLSIMELIHSNNTTFLNSNTTSQPKDAYGNRIYNNVSFSIIKGSMTTTTKITVKEDIYLSLFNYFEVMKFIVNYPKDSNSLFRKVVKIVYTPLIIAFLIMINYFCLMNYPFAQIFLLVSIMYENNDTTDVIIKKLKLWMCLITLVLSDNILTLLWMLSWSFGINISIILRTIFVIVILGNDNTLNAVVFQIFQLMNQLNILIR